MPLLEDFRRTKKISLKAYKDSEVEIYDSILVKDADLNFTGDTKDIDMILKSLAKFIKSWNFVNEKKEPWPIDNNSLGLLSVEAITELSQEITKFIIEVKKNS